MEKIYDVIVLGAGAAGLSAGIYASRGKLDTLILSEGVTGGQMVLTHFASEVTIVHQFGHFQAFAHAVEEAERNPKISFVMESELRAYERNGILQKVQVEQLKTGELTYLETDGVFVFIGYIPNTEAFKGMVKTNERGEFIVDQDMSTNLPGVFAAGDCVAKRYRQVTTAVSDGTIAALSATEYIRKK